MKKRKEKIDKIIDKGAQSVIDLLHTTQKNYGCAFMENRGTIKVRNQVQPTVRFRSRFRREGDLQVVGFQILSRKLINWIYIMVGRCNRIN